MKRRSRPIAQPGITVTVVPGFPFVEGFSRKAEMPAGLSNASGKLVGLPDQLQTPANHSILFSFCHDALRVGREPECHLDLGLHTAICPVDTSRVVLHERHGLRETSYWCVAIQVVFWDQRRGTRQFSSRPNTERENACVLIQLWHPCSPARRR